MFEPLTVRGKVFKNRIVMPPMVVNRGVTTPEGIAWYGRHAAGGPALVIVEATGVARFGGELTAANLKPLVDAIHAGGALAAIQLFPWVFGTKIFPADLSEAQIATMIAGYRTAATICREAGFDGIEPHGAHNYLLNLFFSPGKNKRTDVYGGASLENRMRLGLAIVRAVKPLCGPMLLLYRHTPVGAGYTIEESVQFSRELVAAGVDILDISPASDKAAGDRAAPFKTLSVPVIAVNNLAQAERAVEVIREGRADLCAIGRGLIADPDWPLKVREGRLKDVILCTDCNKVCWGTLRQGLPVACALWRPEAGGAG